MVSERPAPEFIGEIRDAFAPTMSLRQTLNQFGHGHALSDDVGLDSASDIHEFYTSFNFLYLSERIMLDQMVKMSV